METLETPHVKFEKECDFMIATYLQGSQIDLQAAETIVKTRLEFSAGVDMFVVVEGQEKLKFDKDARDYLSSAAGTAGIVASAIVVRSPINFVLGSFFLRVSRPPIPAHLCFTRQQALEWLQTQKTLLKNNGPSI